MKSLSIFPLLCLCLVDFAQGTVQFRNYVSFTTPPIDAPVYLDYLGGVPLSGTNQNYRAALLGGPTTATVWTLTEAGTVQMTYNPLFTTITWVNFDSRTSPGQTAGYVRVEANSRREVPGAYWGAWALVQMVAWEGPYTAWLEAWQAAQSGSVRIGVSSPLTVLLPNNEFGNDAYLWGLEPFAIQFAPEPGSKALAALAAVLCLLVRGMKSG